MTRHCNVCLVSCRVLDTDTKITPCPRFFKCFFLLHTARYFRIFQTYRLSPAKSVEFRPTSPSMHTTPTCYYLPPFKSPYRLPYHNKNSLGTKPISPPFPRHLHQFSTSTYHAPPPPPARKTISSRGVRLAPSQPLPSVYRANVRTSGIVPSLVEHARGRCHLPPSADIGEAPPTATKLRLLDRPLFEHLAHPDVEPPIGCDIWTRHVCGACESLPIISRLSSHPTTALVRYSLHGFRPVLYAHIPFSRPAHCIPRAPHVHGLSSVRSG